MKRDELRPMFWYLLGQAIVWAMLIMALSIASGATSPTTLRLVP
jgi:hypothetical protein